MDNMTVTAADHDLDAIQTLARDFFANEVPLAQQQASADQHMWNGTRSDAQRALHVEMGTLGFFAQAITENAGGLGLPLLASGLISESAGAELVPGCWLDHLVVVRVLDSLGEAVVAPYASGERLAAVAFDAGRTPELAWDPLASTLTGVARRLSFGDEVDRWVIITNAATFVIDPAAVGVDTIEEDPDIDPLMRSISVRLNEVQPEAVIGHSVEIAQNLYGMACGLAGAFSVGAAARVLELAVSHVKERQQFGRPIGSFQAIKHRAANAYIEVLHARALVHASLATGAPGALLVARLAADRCYRHASESALQMHGGIGFTSDVPVHLFMKSAQRMRSWPRPIDEDFNTVRIDLRVDESFDRVEAQ
jgi:alkylation response protein AidB-like acyl-CoA dehydrogenase